MHPANRIANIRRRVNRARNFPDNTCGASRHLHMMADVLSSGKPYQMLTEEPEHCALSIYAVLEQLWKARTLLAKLDPAGEAKRSAAVSRSIAKHTARRKVAGL